MARRHVSDLALNGLTTRQLTAPTSLSPDAHHRPPHNRHASGKQDPAAKPHVNRAIQPPGSLC
jgi:hypothetical protein